MRPPRALLPSSIAVLTMSIGCDTTRGLSRVPDDASSTSAGDALPFDALLPDAMASDAMATDASTSDANAPELDASLADASSDAALADPCRLPGSIRFTHTGTVTVPGGPAATTNLGFLKLPVGFCAHYYGFVGNAQGGDVRQLRFAPGGELFVASPTSTTTGGNGSGGLAAIVVLPDDDHDGTADSVLTFASNLPSTQGLLFTGGRLYYQNATAILSVPYRPGDRTPSAPAVKVADITVYQSAANLHWPKTLDVADDGTIYVSNGGDQGESCDPARPFHGGILKLDGTAGGTAVALGMRNPIALRCARGHNRCFALELSKDYSGAQGGREKLVPIREGDDWGYPCCATRNLPYPDVRPTPDCSRTTADQNAFFIGDTPFGVDFEPGGWPAPWTGNAFVVTHGVCCGSWVGARLVTVPMDLDSGLPVASSDVSEAGAYGQDEGMSDFGTGWDDGSHANGRPAAITFSPDGRLFIGNDVNGVIFWIAPMRPGTF